MAVTRTTTRVEVSAAKLLNFAKRKVRKIVPLRTYLTNVFGSANKKRVLLSYIVKPFIKGVGTTHTNELECLVAAQIFDEMGYAVDIAHFQSYRLPRPADEYEVVYGFGEPLELVLRHDTGKNVTTVFYGSGCHPWYSNEKTAARIAELYDRRGVFLADSARIVEESRVFQLMTPSAIVALGNEFVRETYARYSSLPRIYRLNAFHHNIENRRVFVKKNSECMKKFLWFGSAGLVHKGLDLLLDIFSGRPDLTLHICGLVETEPDFVDAYRSELMGSSNIQLESFVPIGSPRFEWLMDNCGFVIHPTVSEGGAASVLTVMGNGGLIPLVTRMCGLDLEEYGYLMDEAGLEFVERALEWALSMGEREFVARTDTIRDKIPTLYSINNYRRSLDEIIRDIVSNSGD